MQKEKFRIFYIKKNKGYRKIVTYLSNDFKTKAIHLKVNEVFKKRFKPSVFSKAYIKGESIITNVKAHKYNDIFISLDIKDFFSSINHKRLIEKLYYEINKGHKYKISKTDCQEIVNSCSISKKGVAIGLIPSPMLANIYLKEFDNIIYGKLKKMKLANIIYTRYADDLTISYRNKKNKQIENIYIRTNDDIIDIVENILKRYGLKLNKKKNRIIDLNISNHVRITGISIFKNNNDYRSLSVGRKRKNDLFHKTVQLMNKKNNREIQEVEKIKGLQSFILSVEGEKYQEIYSQNMLDKINNYGYKSLKDLIDNLK